MTKMGEKGGFFFDVRCADCGYCELWGLERAIRTLTAAGKLSPLSDFNGELFAELFRIHAKCVVCPNCEKTGVLHTIRTQKGVWDWDDTVHCEDCGQEIPKNRLRAVPNATRCVKCQAECERFGP